MDTHSLMMRAYCRVERCGLACNRLGHRYSAPIISGSEIQRSSDCRVVSVISNRTGFFVLLCVIEARSLTRPAANTSCTFRVTRSQPRNLLSMAVLRSAKSRPLSAISSLTLIVQTCFGARGRFCPMIRPLFHAGRRGTTIGRVSEGIGVSSCPPPAHPVSGQPGYKCIPQLRSSRAGRADSGRSLCRRAGHAEEDTHPL
jgi:hypothetical protein